MPERIVFAELDDYEECLLKMVKEFFEKYPDRKDGFLSELNAVEIEQKEYGEDLE